MATDMIVGLAVLAASVVFSTTIFLVSRRRIDVIRNRSLSTLREISSEFSRGRR
jgi:hypothetical protein